MEQVKAITTEQEAETAVQYIVVRIGNEQYGINIKYIDNIVRNQKITRVPKTQTYYKGVINLRGEIIPVMSIRLKLGLEDDEFTDKTRIIIVKIEGATIGVIVDQVREVVTLDDDNTDITLRTCWASPCIMLPPSKPRLRMPSSVTIISATLFSRARSTRRK